MANDISLTSGLQHSPNVPVGSYPVGRPLHRLAKVRRQEGISRRMLARHLGMPLSKIEEQERETSDISLSTLYAWQAVLDVPIEELLVESDAALSIPVMKRAQLLRIMKTVMAILERSKQKSIRRMAQFLVEQLQEAMPELKEIGPWPAVGQRRSSKDLGQAAFRRLNLRPGVESDYEST